MIEVVACSLRKDRTCSVEARNTDEIPWFLVEVAEVLVSLRAGKVDKHSASPASAVFMDI